MKRIKKAIKDIFWALIIALFIRAFIVQAYKIPTGSMEPTLLVGDFLIVSRLSYGIRIPYLGYAVRWSKPKRGDVIVFIYPRDRSKDFIKRVIAVEGETIEIRNKKIYINGKLIHDSWGYHFSNLIINTRDNFGPYKVPSRHVFVMGDNRDESNDSRFWGSVSMNDIKGKAWRIYFSWDPALHRIRLRRIGMAIK